MKETVNVNIGSVAFILDEDAYRTGQLFRRHPAAPAEGDAETMGDIEARVVVIIPRAGRLAHAGHYAFDVVRATMAQMASPADFGEPLRRERSESAEEGPTESAEQPPPCNSYRSRTDCLIAGIWWGLLPRTSTWT